MHKIKKLAVLCIKGWRKRTSCKTQTGRPVEDIKLQPAQDKRGALQQPTHRPRLQTGKSRPNQWFGRPIRTSGSEVAAVRYDVLEARLELARTLLPKGF